MPPPPYAHAQTNYQHPQTPQPPQPPHAYQPSPYPQPTGSAPYHPLPGYNGPLPPTTPFATQAAPYPSPIPTPQHASPPPNTPVMMGSAPWGEQSMPYGAPPGHGRGHRPSHPHGNHGNHGPKSRHSHKRDHSAAFNKPQTVPRTPAPPPVPSFGNPLPCKPPPAADATRKPKKRKRKHNQLGLTPKTEEHESSEEEEDADEESKLAPGTGSLQFTYKGQTSNLQSASDIAAWIAERKKRFPTAARIEEKKKAGEEAKAARDALRREKEKAKQQEKQEKQDKQETLKDDKEPKRKLSDAQADPAIDAAMKAQRKADKIRRNLDREQKRFAKAEAEAEAARLKVAALQKQVLGLDPDLGLSNGSTESHGLPASCNGTGPTEGEMALATATATAAATTAETTVEATMAEATAELKVDDQPPGLQADPIPMSVEPPLKASDSMIEPGDAMDVNSDNSDSSDWTSSSGSESGSDEDDEDSAPEVASIRREGPERVPPPPRESKKPVCRHFARTGQCQRGDKCKFVHDVRDRVTKTKVVEKKGRKGLFQALLERQKEEEDRRAMEVISWLGENGLLTSPVNGAPHTPAGA
ncbi:hypothetical protein N7470_009154 [Penicillium chermesinum]|nr:hypothetical protein N7470_009154 [Penicillium chermesinum]